MKNVLLLFGGKSFEHDISIITTLIIKNRYEQGKYNLLPVYIDNDNEWFYFAGDKLASHMFADFKQSYKTNKFYKAYLKTNQNYLFFKSGFIEHKIPVYASINCCHGGIGESGELTSILLASKIPTTATNHTALGICMDKLLSKYCFEGLKIKSVKYFEVRKSDFLDNKKTILKKATMLGYPLILKPATLGSSIGISVVQNSEELEKGLDVAFEFDQRVLVEKAIIDKMVEYNIACMRKDGVVITSDIDKPIRTEQILSFKDKYIGNGTEGAVKSQKGDGGISAKTTQKGGGYLGENKVFANDISPKIKDAITQTALFAYDMLGINGVCRIDFIVDKKNNVYLNEINAVPGSLAYYFFVPKVFKNISEFVDCLIEEGIKDYCKDVSFKKEYLTNLFKK